MSQSLESFTIGQVAQKVGMSIHALRFYERKDLLLSPMIARSTSGHRRYSLMDIEWLQMCVKLRASNMPLAEIRRYVILVRQGAGNEQQRLKLLREHQQRIKNQLTDLTTSLNLIERKVKIYEQRL